MHEHQDMIDASLTMSHATTRKGWLVLKRRLCRIAAGFESARCQFQMGMTPGEFRRKLPRRESVSRASVPLAPPVLKPIADEDPGVTARARAAIAGFVEGNLDMSLFTPKLHSWLNDNGKTGMSTAFRSPGRIQSVQLVERKTEWDQRTFRFRVSYPDDTRLATFHFDKDDKITSYGIGQAVCLVRAGFVQGKTIVKALPGLRQHGNRRIGENAVRLQRGGSAKLGCVTESGEKLVQHFIGGDDLGVSEGLAQRESGNMPLVALVGKGDPVEGIGKNPPHSTGRLGVP